MAVPGISGTGVFQGPYQFIHSQDNSSYGVGSSANDIIVGSSLPTSGMIHTVCVTNGNTSSAAASGYTLTIDGTSSAIFIQGFTTGTYLLDIGFNSKFNFSNSSTVGTAVLSFLMANN